MNTGRNYWPEGTVVRSIIDEDNNNYCKQKLTQKVAPGAIASLGINFKAPLAVGELIMKLKLEINE